MPTPLQPQRLRIPTRKSAVAHATENRSMILGGGSTRVEFLQALTRKFNLQLWAALLLTLSKTEVRFCEGSRLEALPTPTREFNFEGPTEGQGQTLSLRDQDREFGTRNKYLGNNLWQSKSAAIMIYGPWIVSTKSRSLFPFLNPNRMNMDNFSSKGGFNVSKSLCIACRLGYVALETRALIGSTSFLALNTNGSQNFSNMRRETPPLNSVIQKTPKLSLPYQSFSRWDGLPPVYC